MAYTTSTLVEGVIDVDSAIILTPFIEAANILVVKYCDGADDDYTDDETEKIETWLAAHFYTVRDMRAEQEKAGSVSERFQSKVDLGLSTSHYGQMAMTLDYQGGLAALNQKIMNGTARSIGVTWVGTSEEEADAD